jgi:predicted GIY-YIG superfamily endonuclease
VPIIDPNKPTALYRLFDSEQRLLYVGITNSPAKRWEQHAETKFWWPDVAQKTVEWLGTRVHADRAERKAIKEEKPLYNWHHAARAPHGVDLSKLTTKSGGRKYRVLTRRVVKDEEQSNEDPWVSYYDPADDDPNGIVNKDGTMYANPAWADMLRRIGAIS